MSNKLNVNDWQSFGIKKDIEKTNKLLQAVYNTGATVLLDIGLAMVALLIDRGFNNNTLEKIIYGALTVVVFVTALIPILKGAFKWGRNKSNSVNIKNHREYVDSFDNEICYYVMTADSFLDLLKKDALEDDNRRVFYYTEARFYLNKAIIKLDEMGISLKQVFSDDTVIFRKEKLIAKARLENVLHIINDIKNDLYTLQHKFSILSKDHINKLSASIEYDNILKDFVNKAKRDLNIDNTESD
ncbi:hypothetical protein AGMMS50268_32220 [Spirochaetia bacterium]|nr:hypothetical protein AGMMS50268_32220 [Spirochaetia bacterium]